MNCHAFLCFIMQCDTACPSHYTFIFSSVEVSAATALWEGVELILVAAFFSDVCTDFVLSTSSSKSHSRLSVFYFHLSWANMAKSLRFCPYNSYLMDYLRQINRHKYKSAVKFYLHKDDNKDLVREVSSFCRSMQ